MDFKAKWTLISIKVEEKRLLLCLHRAFTLHACLTLYSSFTKTHFRLLSPLIQFLTIVSEQHIKLPTEGIKHSHDGFSEHPFEEPVIQGHTSSPPPPHREFYVPLNSGKQQRYFCCKVTAVLSLSPTWSAHFYRQTHTHGSA